MQRNGVVEGDVVGNHWDLGSIPRSTQMFYYFSLQVPMQAFQCVSPCTSHPSAPSGHSHRSDGHEVQTTMLLVNPRIDKQKGQTDWPTNGLGIANKLLTCPSTPHGFLYSFFFFSISISI